MKGRFDALKYAKSLEKQLSADPRKKRLQDDVARLQSRLADEGRKGADVSGLERLLSDASSAVEGGDLGLAEELVSRAEKGLSGLGALSVEEAIARARRAAEDVGMLGLDNVRALELIGQAEDAIRKKDHRSARKLAVASQKEAETALEGSVQDALPYAEGLVSECERCGMDVSGLRGRLSAVRELLGKREYNAALQECTTLVEDIEPARKSFFRERLARAGESVERAREGGRDVSALEGSLARARRLLDLKDFEGACEALGEVEAATGAAAAPAGPPGPGPEAPPDEVEEASGVLSELRSAIAAGTKMGLDLKAETARVPEVEGLLKAGDGRGAAAVGRQVLAKVRERQKALSGSAIASLEDEVARLRKGGASVAPAQKVLEQASERLRAGSHEEAFALARRAVDELDALREGMAGYAEAMSRCKGLLKDAAGSRLDCTLAEPLVEEARAAAARGEYLAAAGKLAEALGLLEDAMAGRAAGGLRRALELVSRADEEGTDLEDVERLALDGLAFEESGEGGRLGEVAATIERLAGSRARSSMMARDALDRAGETMAEAMMEMLDVSDETRKVGLAGEALQRGEYEDARFLAEDVAPALRQRCREALDQSISKAASMVEELGQSGAEMPRAREYLRRSRELAECGRFGLGHSYALQAVQEARAVGDRFREAQDARAAVEAMLESATALGVPREDLEAALSEVSSAIEVRAYERAVAAGAAGLERGEERFAREARALEAGLSELLSSLRKLPIDGSAGAAALKAARGHLGKAEHAEAISALRGPTESLSRARRQYEDSAAALEAALARLSEAEGYGLDVSEIRPDLEAASRAHSSGAYDEGFRLARTALELGEHLISERAAQAMGELRDLLESTERAGTVLDDLHERVGALSGCFSSKAFGGLFKEAVAIRAEIGRRRARHSEAVTAIQGIQAAIEEVKAMGADLSPTEDLLGLARFASERGSYDDVLDYSRRAQSELTAAAGSSVDRQREALAARIARHAGEGVELRACRNALLANPGLLPDGGFRAVLADLKRIETDMEVRRDQHRNTQKVLAAAESRLTEAGSLGVNTADASRLLESARGASSAGDYPKAVELAEQARDIAARSTESHQQTMGAMELARAHLRDAESMGADIARARELLERAAAMFAARNYDDAMALVVESETDILHSQETLVGDTMDLARSTLDEAQKIGADTNGAMELLGRAESARQARDFGPAFALARESYESAQEERSRHSTALGALSEIQEMVQKAQAEGVRVERLVKELEHAREALQRFDYEGCTGTAERVRMQAEECIGAATQARRALERCEAALRTATEMAAQTNEGEGLLLRCREQYQADEYRAALSTAGTCHERLAAAQHRQVWGELGQLVLELDDAEDAGAELSAAWGLAEEAGLALAGGDFPSALLRTRAARTRLAEATHAFEGISSVMLASRLIVDEARFMEADVAVASDLSAGAQSELRAGNYHGTQELALQAAEEATRNQRSLLNQLISTADRAVSEAAGWGIRSRLAVDRLARSRTAMEFQDFKGARDLLEECDDALAQAITDHKGVSDRMAQLTESLVRAEALGLDPAPVRKGAAEAETLAARGEYSRALEALGDLSRELAAAERTLVSDRLEQSRLALEEALAQGVFIADAARAIEGARGALESGQFQSALELAAEASRTVENNRQEHRRVTAIVMELSSEIECGKELGVGVPDSPAVLSGARELLSRGEFAQAEEQARRGRAAVASALTGAMQGNLSALEEELREAERQGVRSAVAAGLLKGADRDLRSRSYSEMIGHIEEARRELAAARRAREQIQRTLESMGERLKETEALGADGEAASALVGRAMEVSSEGDYAQALELLGEADLAVEAAQRVRVEEALSGASALVEEGDAIGADTRAAHKALAGARKALEGRDYRGTSGLAREALEEAERRVGEHRRSIETVAVSEKTLADAESEGLNVERLRRVLEEARRSLRKHDYPAVAEAAARIDREVGTLLRQSSEARRLIGFCERKIDSARHIGADVSSAEALLAEARAATEKRVFVKAFELATQCLRQIDSMQHAVVLGYLTDSELQLAEMEEAGADIAEAQELIEIAIEALNESEFEKSMELGRQAVETARGKMSQHELAAERVRELERKMKDATELGGDLRSIERLHSEARSALQSHDHARLEAIAGEALEAMVGSLHELVATRTAEASAVISGVEEIGAAVARARDRLLRSRRALECDDFKTALNLLEESQSAAGAARLRHAETLEGVKGLQNMAREASELGLDVSRARWALAEVDEAIDEGQYDQADRIISETRAELEKGYLSHAEQALARTEEALVKTRELGADVGAEVKALAELRVIFSQGRYQTVMKSCRECRRRLDERLNEHIAGIILRAENLINEAGKVGVDAREYRETLERSEETVSEGDYEAALRLASEAIDRTRALLRSSISGTISTLGGLIEESRRIGADVREVEEYSRQALSALQKDEYELAHDHALSGIAAVDRVREEFIVRRRQEVERKISEAEAMGAQVEDFRRSTAKAQEFLERADFEKAALLLQETEENTLKRQSRVAEESIRRAEEQLAKVKMDIDLARARSLLDEARSALGYGEFEEAVDYSVQCVEETNRVQAQFVEEVIGTTEETIAAAAQMGADTQKARELLDYSRADREAGNFDAALAKAVQGAEEAEQAQYDFVRGPIEHIRRVMKEARLSDDRIKRLMAAAEGHLEKKEYQEARREVMRAMDLTGEIQEKLARKEIMDSEEVVAGVEKAGAVSPVARNLLRSALTAINARDFEKAMKFSRECSVQAMKTRDEFASAQRAQTAAEAEIATLNELGLMTEETGDLRDLSRSGFSSGDYMKSKEYSAQVVHKAESLYFKAAGEALSSSQFKINYARNIGADVSTAESLLRDAKAANESRDFRRTLELARRCREEAERAKERYKELVDTIYSAESKISVAHTYGLDTSAAERLLSMAVAQKSKNGEEALDFARQSMEEVQRALERFTPDIKVEIKLEGVLQKERWSQASLTISNTGKATAKDISVRFSGDLEVQGGERVSVLRGGESRRQSVRVRPSKGGDLPLGTSVVSLREFDDKEFRSQETRWIRVEDATPLATPLNQFVTKSVRCHICLGTIKSGLPLVRCECGKTYHETCASRVGECPNCGRDLHNVGPGGGG